MSPPLDPSTHAPESGDDAALPQPSPAAAAHVLEIAAARAARGVNGAMATVLEREGSAPGTPGQKLYLAGDGTCVGTVGGGAIERETLLALRAVVRNDRARHEVRTFKLGPELGMCCGGRLVVLLEPIEGLWPCLVVGGGHVATALAPLLVQLGFAVTVIDEREGWSAEARLPKVRCIHGTLEDVPVDVDPRGVCLVMTHDHGQDQRAIEWALRRGFAYVGGVGSRAKGARTRQRLEAKGFSVEDRARVRMPVGLDIGARLPDEIAVAIAAELVAWKKRDPLATASEALVGRAASRLDASHG